MAISRLATASIVQGFQKNKSLLAGNDAIFAGSYESIATVDVGSGGSSTITFASIPQTYTHLQIRAIVNTGAGNIRFNNDSSTNYSRHYLYGNGSTVTAGSTTSSTAANVLDFTNIANCFGANIVDILDYADTNKYKTIRSLTGFETNSQGEVIIFSGLGRSTAAVSTITLTGGTAAQYSSYALYGIK